MTTWESNGHVTNDVTWPWKVKVVTSIYLGPNIAKTAGDRLVSKGPPIGNDLLEFEWSCDWWRHLTQKGQGPYSNIFRPHNLDDGWRYGLDANGAPIGNGYLGIKWSRDRWCHVIQKSQGRDPQHALGKSWKWLEIETWFQWITNRKLPHWDSNGPVTDDVTWHRKVKVMTSIYLGMIISTTVGDTDLVPMEHL